MWKNLWKQLPKESRKIYFLETTLADLKADQEYWGVRIDEDKFVKQYENARWTLDLLDSLLHTMINDDDANLNSSAVLGDILYHKLGCPVYIQTKSGADSTGAVVLAKLASAVRTDDEIEAYRREHNGSLLFKNDIRDKEGAILEVGKVSLSAAALNRAKYPIVNILVVQKKYQKLITAFYNRIIKGSQGRLLLEPKEKVIKVPIRNADGTYTVKEKLIKTDELVRNENVKNYQLRYFFWINQNGSRSGRQSSPMHQLPPALKDCILSDSDDHMLMDADYNQVELRMFALLAGEQAMLDMSINPDADMHRIIAAVIQGKEEWAISAEDRKKDKSRNFGVVYLMSGKGLASQKYGAGATKEQEAECTKSIEDFYTAFPRMKAFIAYNKEFIEQKHYIQTYWKRTRSFPELANPDLSKEKKAAALRQGNNTPVQGTCADLMKECENNYNEYIHKKGWDKLVSTPQGDFPLVRVMLSIHDEVLLSVHKSIPVEEIFLMNRICQEIAILGWSGFYAPPSVINTWGDGKASKYEVPVRLRNKLIDEYDRTGVSCIKDYSDARKVRDQMVEVIQRFKDVDLNEYMEGLVKQAGSENWEDIAKLVRHRSLTHDLIDRYPQPKEHKKQYGEFNHFQRIDYATQQWLLHRAEGFTSPPPKEEELNTKGLTEAEEDAALVVALQEGAGLFEDITYQDEDGDTHFYDESESVDDQTVVMYDDDIDFILSFGRNNKFENVTVLDSLVVLHCGSMYDDDIEEIRQTVCDEKHTRGGYYELCLDYQGSILHTRIKMTEPNAEWIDKMAQEKIAKLREGVGVTC